MKKENEIWQDIKKYTWKDVKDYEGYYQVSDTGLVLSYHSGKILTPVNAGNGYYRVTLCKGKSRKNVLIHKLVAEAFIENPNGFKCVNHKDENPANNCADNLEWCSYQYNNTYGNRLNNINRPVRQYSLSGVLLNEYKSMAEAGRITGFSANSIQSCCSGVVKKSHGYIWKYVN